MKELIRKIKEKRSALVFLSEFLDHKIYYLQNSDLHHVDYYIHDELIFKHNQSLGRLYVHGDLFYRANIIEKISYNDFSELISELTIGKLYHYKYNIREITIIKF